MAPRKAAATARTRTSVTIRLENSISGCNWRAGVRWPVEQLGQSEHPSPEPVRRTAPPVSTMRVTRVSTTWLSRWSREAETVKGRRRDTRRNRTGTSRLV